MIKMKNHYIFTFWNVNNLYGWEILAKVPVNEFKVDQRYFSIY